MGGAPSVPTPKAPDAGQEFQSALNAYVGGAGKLYGEESTWQPQYNQMQQRITGSNIDYYSNAIEAQMPRAQANLQNVQNMAVQNAMGQYGQNVGAINQMVMANSPELQAVRGLSQQQLAAGSTADPTLQGILRNVQQQAPGQTQQLQDLASKASTMYDPTNAALQGLSGQVGAATGQGVSQLQGLAGQAAADTRSPLWQQTTGAVSGQLGNLDPLTQQLSDTAQQQLALGSSLSPTEIADATQQARGAYSARGMLMSNPAMVSEVLNRYNVGQQRLQQREQFAAGVDPLVQQQMQQRTANAMGLSQADLAATQGNRQLAGQLYQGAGGLAQSGAQIQGGLQQQIAGNLGSAAQMQGALAQQAIANQQSNAQLASGIQGGILDQMYRQQQAGSQNAQYLYGAQTGAQGAILGTASGAPAMATALGGAGMQAGTGSPNLFQGSGLLQLTSQNAMAQMNATAAANQMNAQSKGAAQGATMGAVGAIGGALITGVALF